MANRGDVSALHRRIRGCTRCVQAGYLRSAGPVVSGYPDNRIMLIGQAPGQTERTDRVPFHGRAGRVLMRWLMRVGFRSEAEVRRHVYMTAITKCFPGRTPAGDRRPSRSEIELCRPHLDQELAVMRPEVILLVGVMAQARFLPGWRLQDLVGRVFDLDGKRVSVSHHPLPVLVPLPHPSGSSRWLNDPANTAQLDRALRTLGRLLVPYLDALLVGA